VKGQRVHGSETARQSAGASVEHTPGKSTLTSQVQFMPAAPEAPAPMRRLQLKSSGAPNRPSGQSFVDSLAGAPASVAPVQHAGGGGGGGGGGGP